MPFDSGDDHDDWYGSDEPKRETITHRHPSLPFIEITQTRYVDAEPGDQKCEDWSFEIRGPKQPEGYPVAYDGVAYMRRDHSEAEMLADLARRAEKHLLDERGPFFVLRLYLENGQYQKEIDAVMRKHGQSPLWRRAEAAITCRLGVQRRAIRMRYRLRGEKPNF